MATTNIDGQEYEVIEYTGKAYKIATSLANLAVDNRVRYLLLT